MSERPSIEKSESHPGILVASGDWTLANAEAEAGKAGLTAGTMWNFAHDYIGRQARVASAR